LHNSCCIADFMCICTISGCTVLCSHARFCTLVCICTILAALRISCASAQYLTELRFSCSSAQSHAPMYLVHWHKISLPRKAVLFFATSWILCPHVQFLAAKRISCASARFLALMSFVHTHTICILVMGLVHWDKISLLTLRNFALWHHFLLHDVVWIAVTLSHF
jgi:hypothetical protein